VLQENVLFNRSIHENIALSDPTLAPERVMEAARLAGAHDFIIELPKGYDTILEERGSNLSGGQRQRIAIPPGSGHQSAHPYSRRGHLGPRL
jgi:ATP-binding cassette, subfamily B, bacterial HlyB/CyaB